jgi:hypothetical protein
LWRPTCILASRLHIFIQMFVIFAFFGCIVINHQGTKKRTTCLSLDFRFSPPFGSKEQKRGEREQKNQ